MRESHFHFCLYKRSHYSLGSSMHASLDNQAADIKDLRKPLQIYTPGSKLFDFRPRHRSCGCLSTKSAGTSYTYVCPEFDPQLSPSCDPPVDFAAPPLRCLSPILVLLALDQRAALAVPRLSFVPCTSNLGLSTVR